MSTLLCFVALLFSSLQRFSRGELTLGYYANSCPNAETIVYDYVTKHIRHVPSLAPALLRLHFHDCFVRGCDASILLNSTAENLAEKDALPNKSIRGYSFIDRIKSLLEAECPKIVSCADLVALVARDAIGAIGGPRWRVPTGRKDGFVSAAEEAEYELPDPDFDFESLRASFYSKGLDISDLVYLSGAHTIGFAHCSSFNNRLYNYTGHEDQDPKMDPCYAERLKEKKCTSVYDDKTIVEMDPGSSKSFDTCYYKNLVNKRALFQSDAALLSDRYAKALVVNILQAPVPSFLMKFSLAMEKMGRIMVKTGLHGEIRKNCALVNQY